MIDVKNAVKTAYNYMREVYPEPPEGLRLEEVELSEDGEEWLITMGYNEEVPPPSARNSAQMLAQVGRQATMTRTYKRLIIDGETGKVKAMRIRAV